MNFIQSRCMKTILSCSLIFLLVSCVNGKERVYTASTPAAPVIRSFLKISATDSIDFIRWKLTLLDNRYMLQCNYGIGKPNTNGFLNGGTKIELSGELKKEAHLFLLQNENKILALAELNADLLHLLDTDKSLLIGNGGWSYTLNNVSPLLTDQVNMAALPAVLKDSTVFDGRTPCAVPGIINPGSPCYKIKWRITFYGNAKTNLPLSYKILGTSWREENGKAGTWEIITSKTGKIMYRLNDKNGKAFIYLLKLDEHILVFTDADGKLLVGNEDFSYTLNRII